MGYYTWKGHLRPSPLNMGANISWERERISKKKKDFIQKVQKTKTRNDENKLIFF